MILRKTGKKTNAGENKITDAEFFGNRLNVLNKTICPKGTALSLRKHYEDPITLAKLIKQGVLNEELAELISVIIASERSFVMGGITGSGKSTTLRALLNANLEYQNKRVVVVEDTQELFLKVKNSVEAVTFAGNEKTSITQTDLIIASLRMRPRIIVIGEIRGPEIYSAVQAAATGHMLITSCHGETSTDIINRLVIGYQQVMPNMTDAMVEKVVASSISFVMIQDDNPLYGRKLSILDQLVIDQTTGRCALRPIARFNFENKDWDFFNTITKDTQYNMLRRGIPKDRLDALTRMMQEKIEITKSRGVEVL